ncbi:MAG TPA: hypothetical protein VNZ03_34025 [Terriglobales bacterium]|nr:hypothetical protein [Terriglobales bacterium]
MRNAPRSASYWMFVALVVILCFASSATRSEAQTIGNDAVYNSNARCFSTTSCGFSGAFIDASASAQNQGTDVCATIYNILAGTPPNPPYPSAGAVIDARGISGSALKCAAGTTPWNNGATTVSPPSTILLPDGTILIPKSWILPANTRLIGEGDNPSAASGTTIQACNSNINSCSFSDGAMIQFGSSLARGISVEKVTLDGQGQSINGIVNSNSGSQTYVDRITLFQILGVGLLLESSASYSGPYTNITFDTGAYTGLPQTTCAQLYNVTGGTHGIHGLTCISQTADANSAVLLDSSNNSIVRRRRVRGFAFQCG